VDKPKLHGDSEHRAGWRRTLIQRGRERVAAARRALAIRRRHPVAERMVDPIAAAPPSPGRYYYSTLSLTVSTVIGCHSIGVYTLDLAAIAVIFSQNDSVALG
jgi:hypothetical protein